jgi:hypothetical protein
MRARVVVAGAAALLLGLGGATPARAQAPAAPTLAVLPVLFNAGAAYQITDDDRALVALSDERLREGLKKQDRFVLMDDTRVAEALRAQNPGPDGCRESACIQGAGSAAGADVVLATMLTKFSNLIWFLDGTLLDARTGEVLHREHLELKGAPADMVRGGIASLARRFSEAAAARPTM